MYPGRVSLGVCIGTGVVSDNADRVCTPSEFLSALTEAGISHSVAGDDRLWRSHGHTMHEIFALRSGQLPPMVDVVVWPGQ